MTPCYGECAFDWQNSFLFWQTIERNKSHNPFERTRTVSSGTHSLTCPTVYASYETMAYRSGCGSTRTHGDVLVALDPKAILVHNMRSGCVIYHDYEPEIFFDLANSQIY
jgi:hypothetical protein